MKRSFRNSILFEKKLSKLSGKELKNIVKKIDEILCCEDLNFYKNLRYELKRFKRVHVNNSYVILFFDKSNFVYFVDYEHHDKIYRFDKKSLEKYKNIKFK